MIKVNRRHNVGTSNPERPAVDILFLEKVNHRFRRTTNATSHSGLSVCVGNIVSSLTGHRTLSVGCDTVDDVKNALRIHRPAKVVFEAIWIRAAAMQPLQIAFPQTKFYVHIHSHVPFLAVEAHAIDYLNGYFNNSIGVIFNHSDAFHLYSKRETAYHLPNLYAQQMRSHHDIPETEFLNVGCFGSFRPMKNQIMQAMVAIEYAESVGKRLKFHVNYSRSEDNGDSVKANMTSLFMAHPTHQMVSQAWMNQKQFIDSIMSCDISMQVSMSESFNLVAADSVAAGVPLVVSPEIYWASKDSMALYSDPVSILRTMKHVHGNKPVINANQALLQDHNKQAQASWLQFIKS